ncbi:alpha-1,2-fucosyltransferase [Enterococcus italicus]|uniref:alpha-1,2-fucosyltransferase n=1 Tax=Enterococcus italicus TaxID=246144 RepID=UPI0020730D8D|nr:alpha-1,2-fucosyltransferase [Enterococcus italicus]
MLFVEMYGRLGNQMFRYAMARSIQLKYYPEDNIIINFNNLKGPNILVDDSFRNELINFQINEYKIYEKKGKVLFNETTFFQKFIFLIFKLKIGSIKERNMTNVIRKTNRLSTVLNKCGIYWSYLGYQKPLKSKFKNKFISGNFESSQYFNDIKPILKKEFTPKKNILSHNIELMEKIQTTNSVCLSVRRGDFVQDKNLAEIHSVTSIHYFEEAMNVILNKIDNPVFFIFSDDVEWVKKNIDFKDYEVYSEIGNDPVWEKLRLMYSCKNFIISNSTFSWWAQYLSDNDEKLVICPSKWFNSDYVGDLIEDDFITIEV